MVFSWSVSLVRGDAARRFSYRPSVLLSAIAVLGLAFFGGCSDEPKPPPRFQLDPQQAADDAMRLYDKNTDGKLDAKELEQSPPLKEMLVNLKSRNPSLGDSLTAADIAGRMKEWVGEPATLLPGSFTVNLDGKPLQDATLVFEPEPYLGKSYRTHTAKTDLFGNCELDGDVEGYPGIYVGLYRVRISKVVNGKETLPERFNAQTTLGREIATNIKDSRANLTINLKSK